MGDEKTRQFPLTEKEVAAEAKKLATLADTFLDKTEAEAFDKWHSELRIVAKHGVPSTKQVFKTLEKDSAVLRGPKIIASEHGNSAEITIQRSRPARMFGSKPYIGSIVDPDEVLSAAKTLDGKTLAGISLQSNISSNPFEIPMRRFDPLVVFPPTKPSALDLINPKPQPLTFSQTKPFELLLPKK